MSLAANANLAEGLCLHEELELNNIINNNNNNNNNNNTTNTNSGSE
jgi:hypothetical protein